MTKEGFSQIPQEQTGDKKEEQKQSAKTETHEFVEKLKEKEGWASQLKEKFDHWREQM